ncbi:MAG: hypothetical protein J6Q96_01115 [Bacteroidales bacterium]|nr:hypothetical protein [Bacteroidales bacterium]
MYFKIDKEIYDDIRKITGKDYDAYLFATGNEIIVHSEDIEYMIMDLLQEYMNLKEDGDGHDEYDEWREFHAYHE